MSYYEQPFSSRFGRMGDEAEEAYISHVNPKAIRSGLNRPELDVRQMPLNMRSAPDITDLTFYAECVGIGRDGTAKVRFDKFKALHVWSVLAPVKIFVWSSTKKVWWLMDFDDFEEACHKHGEVDFFPDNHKPYWRLHFKNFPGEAHGTT